MLPKTIRKYWLAAAGTVSVLAVIASATLYLGQGSVGELVEVNAKHRAQLLANFLAEHPEALDALLTGMTRDPDIETRVVQIATAAGIGNFSIFDINGREVFSPRSERYSWLLRERPGGTVVPNQVNPALQTDEGDWTSVGTDAEGMMAAVLPLERGGHRIGYLSASSDLVVVQQEFIHILGSAMSLLLVIVVASVGLPLWIYIRRKHRIEQADERINFLANYDSLTHLLNRSRIQQDTDRILATARATREQLALWQLDLEGLGEINNTHGQEVGDELLRQVATRLVGVVDRNDLIARMGADDFVILQRRLADKSAVGALAKRICEALKPPVEIGPHVLQPRICMGVALAPEHGRTFTHLARHAELAMMVHKSSQQSDFILFDSTIDQEAHRRREIEKRVRIALETDAFELFYQPIVASQGYDLVGFEALLRMPDGEGGYISPASFIPIAEARGYIKAIGDWVIREAVRQISRWPDHLTVSVNLSAVQFRDGDLVEVVRSALADNGVSGRRLEIEVVESLLLDRSDFILDQLNQLKSLGITIAMDDFGTGYSSLGYLWRFPFDKLKIDQSFMVAFDQGEANVPQILQTIISLAHHMRMRVTTEGIETAEQRELLTQLGCDLLQGYHFGKPMPADRVASELLQTVSERTRAAGTRNAMGRASADQERIVTPYA